LGNHPCPTDAELLVGCIPSGAGFAVCYHGLVVLLHEIRTLQQMLVGLTVELVTKQFATSKSGTSESGMYGTT